MPPLRGTSQQSAPRGENQDCFACDQDGLRRPPRDLATTERAVLITGEAALISTGFHPCALSW